MSIRVLSLDLWGTVIDRPRELPMLLANYLASRTRLSASAALKLIRDTGREFDELAIESGLDQRSRLKVGELLCRAGLQHVPHQEVEVEIKRHLRLAPPFLIEPEPLANLMDTLRRRDMKLVFASNSGFVSGAMMRPALLELGLLRSPTQLLRCVFSGETGAAKPSSAFFRDVCRGYGPQEVLHVGDNFVADFLGIIRFGGNGLLFRRGTGSRHSHCIASLREVNARLR